MRRSPFQTWCLVVAIAGLALTGAAGRTVAQTGPGFQQQSTLRVSAGELGTTRKVRLGVNKALSVELPREVRDIVVPNPNQIDAVLQSSTRAFLVGKSQGAANVFFIDKDGHTMLTLEIEIEFDLEGLTALLNQLIPSSHIQVQMINQRAVLSGSVKDPVDANRACEIVTSYIGALDQEQGTSSASGGGSATTINTGNNNNGGSGIGSQCVSTNVIDMLTVDSKEQVLLKVSVVEMERNIVKQFGIDLNTLVNSGNFAFAALSDLPFAVSTQGKGTLLPFTNPPFVSGTAGGGVQWQSGPNHVQTVIRALEEDNLVHILAEPNLTAISGETANFLAGGEFPVPIPQASSGTAPTITIQYKPFGVGLAFTPVVMSEGRISLKVSTEVSELTNQGAVVVSGFAIPALNVRRAETTVELPSGGSLAMAGLLSDQSRQALSGYPGLKNLPVLGTLFRSRDFQKDETELVVIVTPYIAKSVPREQLAQPDDGFGWASDVHSDLLGQMNRIYGRNPERAPVGKFQGDVGYIVE